MRGVLDFVAGLLLRRIVGPPASERRHPASRRRRRGAPARRREKPPPPVAPRPVPSGRPRGPLVGLMLGAFAVGAVLMLLFEAWFTRLVGVLALFTFVVAGVFVIAGSGLLDAEDE